MTFEIRRADQHVRRPWRNGGGMTAEVAAWPPDADAASEFDWRVSFAEVGESGDFSLFPGVDRVITLLGGPPMTLAFPRSTEVLKPFRPVVFDGGLRVTCTVEAPTRDLNAMTRRGRARATVEVHEFAGTGGSVAVGAADPLLLVALTGEVGASVGEDAVRLAPGDVLITDQPVTVDGEGRVAAIHLEVITRL